MSDALQTPDYTQNFDTLLYRVRPGDSLSRILQRYHTGLNDVQLSKLSQQVQADNPALTDPDRMRPDQLISLKIPQQYCAAPLPNYHLPTVRTDSLHWVPELERTWDRSTREERDLLSALLPAFIGLGSAKMSMIDTTFATNAPLLREMVGNYEDYKAGQKTKGQYDYQRQKLVSRLTTNLGPTNLILNGGQKPTEVLRISNSKGTVPTAPLQTQIQKMTRAASVAKAGGVALTAVSLSVACHQIGQASTQKEKNEILVESSAGLIGGLVFGLSASAAVLIMATPVGWVGAFAIGAGSALSGYTSGKLGLSIYDTMGNKIDFAAMTGVDRRCIPTANRRGVPKLSNSTLSVL